MLRAKARAVAAHHQRLLVRRKHRRKSRQKRQKKKADREAAQKKQKEEEQAHMAWLAGLTSFEGSNIDSIDWSAVEKQVLLKGGTSILKMADGKVGSVRRVDSPAMEVMAMSLAKVLGLSAAPCRSVHPGSDEYVKIAEMTAKAPTFLDDMPLLYEEFIKQLKEANPDGIPTEMKLPLLPFEFSEPTRGTTLLDLSAKSQGTVFVTEFQKGKLMHELCGGLSKEAIQSLGRLGVLGVLLNATDMMPLPIWRESGGMTHALKLDGKEDGAAIFATDLRVNPLAGEALAEYTSRLKMMGAMLEGKEVEALKGYPAFTSAATEAMVLELLKKIGFDIEGAALADFTEGLKAGVKAVVDSVASGEFEKVMGEAEAAASACSAWQASDVTAKACKDFFVAVAGTLAGKDVPAAGEVGDRVCAKCGAAVKEGWFKCGKCGARVETADA